MINRVSGVQREGRLTLEVDARALTTPVISSADQGASAAGSGEARAGAAAALSWDFDFERRSHHSAPIVHSLS